MGRGLYLTDPVLIVAVVPRRDFWVVKDARGKRYATKSEWVACLADRCRAQQRRVQLDVNETWGYYGDLLGITVVEQEQTA
jgi:hypothetical protein